MEAGRRTFGIVGIVCLMLAGSIGQAENRYWFSGAGSEVGQNLWSNELNWSGSTIPTASDRAYLDTTADSAYGAAFIEGPTAAVSDLLILGNGDGNTGKLTIYDGASLTTNAPGGAAIIGDNAGHGYLNVKPGAEFTALDYMQLAKTAGSYGFVDVQGTDADPGVFTCTSVHVGTVGTGEFYQNGGTVNASGGVFIGREEGSTGLYQLEPHETEGVVDGTATLTTADRLTLALRANSTGTLSQAPSTSITYNSADEPFIIGQYGTGTYNISGGSLTLTQATVNMRVGHGGTATVNQTGGDITVAGSVHLAFYGYAEATYNMDGGTLDTTDLTAGTITTGSADFNFGDGDIYLDGNREGFDAANDWFHVTGDAGLYRETYDSGTQKTHLFYSSGQLVGDANGDGVVDDKDLSLLLANWNQDRTGEPDGGWSKGEFNGEAPVQDADLSLLLANWTALQSGAIPEPVTAALLVAFAAALPRRRLRI